MHSPLAFLAVAAAVTLTPGPAFALLLQTAAAHGRRAALANIAGNSVGVLIWGVLSALGISALIAANEVAYDVLRIGGAAFLLYLGGRALLARGSASAVSVAAPANENERDLAWRAARKGLVNCLANPKLAVFFVALFPQFLTPGTPVLPAALGMACVIVLFDIARLRHRRDRRRPFPRGHPAGRHAPAVAGERRRARAVRPAPGARGPLAQRAPGLLAADVDRAVARLADAGREHREDARGHVAVVERRVHHPRFDDGRRRRRRAPASCPRSTARCAPRARR